MEAALSRSLRSPTRVRRPSAQAQDRKCAAAVARMHTRPAWPQLKDRHAGAECLYIGNGPSLNKLDWSFLNAARLPVVMGALAAQHACAMRFAFRHAC